MGLNHRFFQTKTAIVADENFDTNIYSTATSPNSITGLNFQPSLTWAKSRDFGYPNILGDSVRGLGNDKMLISEFQGEEGSTDVNYANCQAYGYISSLDSTGFTGTSGTTNGSFVGASGSGDYVSWNWKAGGTAVSNTDGTITSQVSANVDAGFSIVTYTGNNTSGATIGHGLGDVPDMIIVKNMNATANWRVYNSAVADPEEKFMSLNNNDAIASATVIWNDTAPTSTVFSIGNDTSVNTSGENYIAYCWRSIASYSKIGTYAGNSGTLAVTGLGFQPKMVIYKGTILGNWIIFDAERGAGKRLIPSTAAAESNWGTGGGLQSFDADGFTVKDDASGSYETNKSGINYIYIAFA